MHNHKKDHEEEPITHKSRYKKEIYIFGKDIHLCKTNRNHATALYELIHVEEILKHLTIQIQTFEDFLDYLRFINAQWNVNQDFTYTILKHNEEIIGQVTVYDINFTHQRGEVGLWIGVPHQHQGLGTKALKRLINYAFKSLHLNRLQAHIFEENTYSRQLFEKLGFKMEGLHRQYVKKKGYFIDVYEYALLHGDYVGD